MAKVQDIQVINIDDTPHAVESMSEQSQRLVAVYNEWNQKEADIRNELMIIQAAKETLSRQIIENVRNEMAEANGEPEAPADVEPVPVEVAEVESSPEGDATPSE